MTTPHRTLQMALDALIYHRDQTRPIERSDAAITALREALSAPEPELVAHLVRFRTARTAAAMTRDNSGPCTDWGPWCAMMPHEVQMQKGTTLPDCMQTMPLYAAPPAAPAVPLQGGLDNNELLAAWQKKLPGRVPEGQELNAFAVGIEVGFEHAQRLERMDWDRVHHVLAKHGKHPGRTDDHLADVIDKALSAAPAAPVPDGWVMVPRGLLRRLIAEALTFDPSLQDKEAIEQAKQLAASPAAPAAPPAAPAPAQPVPLTQDQIADCTRTAHRACDAKGPMTRWSTEFARAIEAAHGITGGKP